MSWASLLLAMVGNIGWAAVMVMAFDVVDGMEQLTAFVTSMGALFFGLGLLLNFVFGRRF